MISQLNLESLYEQDYCEWLDITLNQLQNKDIEHLDWVHLIEEIEALGLEQKHKVESYLRQLLKHLLLYHYWKAEKPYCQNGWSEEIDNFRSELEILLRSKNLYNYCVSIQHITYQKARRAAIKKTELNPNIFPQECPYSLEEILDFDFLPN
ncbi:DUF29 domain-containing protein [Aphanothece sacrum]|uniref:DUF29 domain-containing protein n=1 Tax=Aphanothece sacrum FPU1 TaxID=1920663 RepID=A0A401ID42_APHSA|nr:DUF29 domain-containing protein [Aphanothece sacrum]GBF79195.1 hypothetical protein AsFPU1_0587 [Aphanothece sacrum FPU1]GBF86585.1 hypothetical protein AsFPU3_3656 [Aphanothece sacrum FPU3]